MAGSALPFGPHHNHQKRSSAELCACCTAQPAQHAPHKGHATPRAVLRPVRNVVPSCVCCCVLLARPPARKKNAASPRAQKTFHRPELRLWPHVVVRAGRQGLPCPGSRLQRGGLQQPTPAASMFCPLPGNLPAELAGVGLGGLKVLSAAHPLPARMVDIGLVCLRLVRVACLGPAGAQGVDPRVVGQQVQRFARGCTVRP